MILLTTNWAKELLGTLKLQTIFIFLMGDSKEDNIRELMNYGDLHNNISQHFEIIDKIGCGTFSSVYLASMKINPKKLVALKHVLPTSHPTRTENELNCLKTIGGQRNVVHLLTAMRHMDSVIIIMDYMPHNHFIDYVGDMHIGEMQMYIQNLLIALQHIHKFHLIHRDIKPSNFLYDRKNRRFCLVDFGLSQKVDPTILDTNCTPNILKGKEQDTNASQQTIGKENISEEENKNPSNHRKNLKTCSCYGRPSVCRICLCRPPQMASRAGTAGFRAPEVLLKIPNQTPGIDVWSAGIIYMSLLCGMHPIFKPIDDFASLCQIICIFGSEEVTNMAKKYDKLLTCSVTYPPLQLDKVCQFLRKNRKQVNKSKLDSEIFMNCSMRDDDKENNELNNREKIFNDDSATHNQMNTEYKIPNTNTSEAIEDKPNVNSVLMNNSHQDLNSTIVDNYVCFNDLKTIHSRNTIINKSESENNDIITDLKMDDKMTGNNVTINSSFADNINGFDIITIDNKNDFNCTDNHKVIKIKNNITIDDLVSNGSVRDNEFIGGNKLIPCTNGDTQFTNNNANIPCVNRDNEFLYNDSAMFPCTDTDKELMENNILNTDSANNDDKIFNLPMVDLAFDLLSQLLEVDPGVRWTAAQALLHPFFNQNF